MRKYILSSLLLHMILLLIQTNEVTKEPQQTSNMSINFVSTSTIVESSKDGEMKCSKFFGGIGIIHSGLIVSKVIKGYPAYIAGIQEGDYLINPDSILGEVGTKVFIQTMRGDKIISYNLIRAKICQD